MPRRKRKDPVADNILADPTHDQVINQERGKSYWLVSDEDMSTALGRGYTRVERREGGPRPARYIDGTDGAGYRVNNQLTLMEIPTERRDAIQAASEQRFNRVLGARRQAALNPQSEGRYVSYDRDPAYPTKFEEAR
ncbi:MAG TPA: hypothetical protein VFL67_20005 [Mycobacterium sp.]|nr:hypothetical protein [Mycobacterium sp.]